MRSYQLTNDAFLKHMEQLKADYEHIFCINLLKKDKSGESILTEAFEKHILNNDLPYVKYEYFDLHHVCNLI